MEKYKCEGCKNTLIPRIEDLNLSRAEMSKVLPPLSDEQWEDYKAGEYARWINLKDNLTDKEQQKVLMCCDGCHSATRLSSL